MARKALGKGIGALIPDAEIIENVKLIELEKIKKNPYQPRGDVEKELEPLVESIKKQGVLEPILVRKEEDGYLLIAGERRLLAAKKAGFKKIPSMILNVSDNTVAEITLVENLLREDLNPIEEATGFALLIEKFGYTHEKIGELVGLDRATVSNKLRLLRLDKEVKDLLREGKIQEGHAKLLITLSPEDQKKVASIIVKKQLSVRETENVIKRLKQMGQKSKVTPLKVKSEYLQQPVYIKVGKRGGGQVVIKFKNKAELKEISKRLGLTMEEF